MKRLLAVAFSVLFAAAQSAPPDPVIYTEARTPPSTFRDRGPSYAPTYLIYADNQRTPDEAKRLIDDLGMLPHLD